MESQSTQTTGLEVAGFNKRIADFSLHADFVVGAGERVGILGPSGSGKTSLLRWIAGLDRLLPGDSGQVRLAGRDLTDLAPEKREIGLVSQDPYLLPQLSVTENVALGLQLRGVARDEREYRALQALESLGVRELRTRRVSQLSGGEKQRVAFLRAWIWEPKLLLLDEPFSALDSETRKKLRKELLVLHSKNSVPLLIVSHDPEDIRELCTSAYGFTGLGQNRTLTKVPIE